MIQYTVANTRLMDMPQFGVANIKCLIMVWLPLFFKQFLMQIKNIFLKIESKCLHIRVFYLTLLKFAPSGK